MTQPPSPSAAVPPLSITLAIEAARAEWAKEGSNLSSAVRAALAVYRDTEIDRLNKWADGFSDAQLKERRLCEERIKEIEAERDRLAAERAMPAASDHEAAKAIVQEWMRKTSPEGWLVEEFEDLDELIAAALAERGERERQFWTDLIALHLKGRNLNVSAFLDGAAIRRQTLTNQTTNDEA